MRNVLIAALLLSCAASARAAPEVTGDWIVQDRSAVIAIERCGAGLCGRIARALIRKPGYPQTDIHNPKPALRGRLMLGLQILSGFTPKQDRWDGGTIYDPESGKSYKSVLRVNADGSLKVSGCILFFCQSQRWTRN